MLNRIKALLLNKWFPITLLAIAATGDAALLVEELAHHLYVRAWTSAWEFITCCVTIWGIFISSALYKRASEDRAAAFVYWALGIELRKVKVNNGN